MNTESSTAAVVIIGVNQVGHESADALMTDGRDVPWLKETATQDVWTDWDVVYRDVIIVDQDNRRLSAFNLTDKDLSVPANYAALKTRLLEALAAQE